MSSSLPCRTSIGATTATGALRVPLTGQLLAPHCVRTGSLRPFRIGTAAILKTSPPNSMPSSDGWMIFSGLHSGYRAAQVILSIRTFLGAIQIQAVHDLHQDTSVDPGRCTGRAHGDTVVLRLRFHTNTRTRDHTMRPIRRR